MKGSEEGGLCLEKDDVLEIAFQIYTPRAAGLAVKRRSTWMRPIINGHEGHKLHGEGICTAILVSQLRLEAVWECQSSEYMYVWKGMVGDKNEECKLFEEFYGGVIVRKFVSHYVVY